MPGKSAQSLKTILSGIGQGTWYMGDSPDKRSEEIRALRAGVDLGLFVIDTAEMYGGGRSETLVGEAVRGLRDKVFLISKVLPSNASRRGTKAACERSLKRLGTDTLDLYLLHWRGDHPFAETVAGMHDLLSEGKIRHWGVSNLDLDDMNELSAVAGGRGCAANELLYNLSRRGIEFDLLPWSRERGMPIIAYSPVEQGRILDHPAIVAVAKGRRATPAQVALAWAIRQPGVIAIPKAGTVAHVTENAKALSLTLNAEDLAVLDKAFPPPTRSVPLELL